ncbi:MAG: SUMF1/EgtB/PvdO family nonheme iron enzyme, partial [Treponema sp.]|nr:SUMF1/EgtB/PvdO family nonheme iron enzyme [Treponema sp.]
PFKISNAPITQDQYEFVMKTNPSKLKGPNRPVECVNWCDAIIYCNKFSYFLLKKHRVSGEPGWRE